MALSIIKSPFLQNIGGVVKKVFFETSADQVATTDAEGAASTVQAEIEALRKRCEGLLENADALSFKGLLDADHPLPASGYRAGDVYRVNLAGTYAGQPCEVGDLVICVAAYAEGGAGDADWTVAQGNLDGAVTGPQDAAGGNLASFDGATGRVIADSGVAAEDVKNAVTKKWAAAVTEMPEGEELAALLATLHEGAIIVVEGTA